MPLFNRQSKASSSNSGASAERFAADYLRKRGLTIETCNFAIRQGEIDIVARDGDLLVFVEVRLRNTQRYGGAVGSINASKIARIQVAAEAYLQQHYRSRPPPCRFDVIAMSPASDGQFQLEWLTNAFGS